MPKPECAIELFNRENRLGLLSIRGRVLVLNPHVLLSPGFAEMLNHPGLDLSIDNAKSYFQNICCRCNLCTPFFLFQSESESPRIVRDRDESIISLEVPETKTFEFTPRGASNDRTICVIDDDDFAAEILALNLSGYGFHSFGISPGSRGVTATRMEINAFAQMVLDKHPDAVISDKGLGWIDGLELIDQIRIRNDRVVTALVTGEWNTRETHKKAHLFFVKPADTDQLVESILNYRFEEE